MLRLISLVLLTFCSSCSVAYHKHEHTHLYGAQVIHTEERESESLSLPDMVEKLKQAKQDWESLTQEMRARTDGDSK